jgi:putative transposase
LEQEGARPMANKKKRSAEEIVKILRDIEIEQGKGLSQELACKKSSITIQTYYRWRKEFGGLGVDQARRLKELESENMKLKRLVADLALDNSVLKEINKGNF